MTSDPSRTRRPFVAAVRGSAAAALVLVVGLALGFPGTAAAQPAAWTSGQNEARLVIPAAGSFPVTAGHVRTAPVDVGTEQIVDDAGVGADTPEAQEALAALKSSARINLYAVLVDSFDGVDKDTWVRQAFTASDLGSNDLLLAIAVQDRRFSYQAGVTGNDFTLTKPQVDEIMNNDAVPHLSDGDWSGAIVAAAQGLLAAATGAGTSSTELGSAGGAGSSASDSGGAAAPGNPASGPASVDPGGSGAASGAQASTASGLGWLWLLVLLALGVGGFLWYRASARRKTAARAAAQRPSGPPPEPYEKLSNRSVAALIATDNAVQASEAELSLARAEFGDEATAEFSAVHDDAKAKLTQAFSLRQQIDDEIAESEQIRRDWMAQIIDLCQQASDALEAPSEKFNALRDLKARLPQVLTALPLAIDAQAARLPAAAAALERMAGAYSPAAISAVTTNTDQANERLEFARSALHEAIPAAGGSAATSGDTATAVLHARAAQEAIQQATRLLDAIERLDGALVQASAKLGAQQDAVAAELADVRAALAAQSAGGATAAITAQLDAVAQVLTASRTIGGAKDPIATMQSLGEADRHLDDILAATQSAQQREARDRQALDSELHAAGSVVATADDFIATRRGAVASTARTRLAEAQRHLAQAQSLAPTDARAALGEARQATSLARQAYAEAQNDMNQWGGGGFGGGGGGPRMNGIGSAILGGIIGGMLSGGGRGGGWGGGFGGFGGGGFGGGGGGFGGGGFSGGGGFGGGGGFSGGGSF